MTGRRQNKRARDGKRRALCSHALSTLHCLPLPILSRLYTFAEDKTDQLHADGVCPRGTETRENCVRAVIQSISDHRKQATRHFRNFNELSRGVNVLIISHEAFFFFTRTNIPQTLSFSQVTITTARLKDSYCCHGCQLNPSSYTC